MTFTIIIPVYNTAPYLHACLDSVLSQTVSDFELLLIDDGSTDGSGILCENYAQKDARIRVFHQTNMGQSAARNLGMSSATGKYLYFIDSDDVIKPNALKFAFEQMERHCLDELIFGTDVFLDGISDPTIESKYREYYAAPMSVIGCVMSGKALFTEWMQKGQFHVSPPLRVFRRSSLPSELRFPVGLIHEDNYFCLLALLTAERVMVVDNRLYTRRIRPESTMTASASSQRHADGYFGVYQQIACDLKMVGHLDKRTKMAIMHFRREMYGGYISFNKSRRTISRKIADYFRWRGFYLGIRLLLERLKRCLF